MKLYGELSGWWPLLSAPEDYAEEAAFYYQTLAAHVDAPPRTLVEFGSGGGNNASHLKRHFGEVVLVEPSPGMRAVSQTLNPECVHLAGDMRTARLDRTFDCVFVHDAVCYMTSDTDLRAAMATAFVHTRPGGAALFAPDYVRDTFRPSTECGGHDAPDGRGLRYLEWVWDPDPADSIYTADYSYLLRAADGSTRVEHDRHIEGLFARDEWLRWLTDAGFHPRIVPFTHSEVEGDLVVFLAVRPR